MTYESIVIETLIESVKRRAALYDKNDVNYFNRVFTHQQWKDVADELGTDEASAKRKWTKVRDYFYKQVKLGRSQWYLYQNMLFLLPHLSSNLSISAADDDLNDITIEFENGAGEELQNGEIVTPPASLDFDSQYAQALIRNETENNAPPQENIDVKPVLVKKPLSKRMKLRKKKKNFSARNNKLANSRLEYDSQFLPNTDHLGDPIKIKTEREPLTLSLAGLHSHEPPSCYVPPAAMPSDCDNGDELFLRSFLPHLGKMEPIVKMECLNELHSTLIRFMRQTYPYSAQGQDSSMTMMTGS